MPSQTLTLEDIYRPVEQPVQGTPQAILDILSTDNELAGDVIAYFFSGKGKLLRPALTFLGAALKDETLVPDTRLLKLGSSFEIFHAATLIHDDIIDSAYLRRNLPTINTKWDSQTAVLVGDYLHDKALAQIFENGNKQIFMRFLETAGLVCDGEIHELNEKFNFDLSEESYFEIIDKKTAVLLACCVEAGARFAGGSEEEASALKKFGHAFGKAFQIVDDCLDFMAEEHEFGKTLGADCAAGVLTLPLIRLLDISDEKRKQEMMDIFKAGEGAQNFKKILDWVREENTVKYAMNVAEGFSAEARESLKIFPENAAKQSLDKLVDYVLERSR